MFRAGVFVGVDRVGSLDRLHDAAAGAKRMHQWAISQGMVNRDSAILITDSRGKRVHPQLIKDAVKKVVDGAGAEQLILYFAGHGMYVNQSETWLLSEAPDDANAAINVTGSVEAARFCGIDNIVIISDACRSPTAGIVDQNIQGVLAFPNRPAGSAKPVDQFFACGRGNTAAELATAKSYSALYTGVLLEALAGQRGEVLEQRPPDAGYFVETRTLDAFLKTELPRVVLSRGLQNTVNQNPDSIIVSAANWLARFGARPAVAGPTEPPGSLPPSADLTTVATDLVRDALGGAGPLVFGAGRPVPPDVPGAADLQADVERLQPTFGPDRFESHCGFKVTGASIANIFTVSGQTDNAGDVARIWSLGTATTAVIEFDRGFGTALPAIPDFVTAITVEGGEIVDVTYEPSANTRRWSEYEQRKDDIRALRAVAAAATRHSRFRLSGSDADGVAYRMRLSKGVDPSLAVYAAYAYLDLNAAERVAEISRHLYNDLNIRLFDIELLARNLLGAKVAATGILPMVPMLSQGWALLPAHGVVLPPALDGLQSTLRQSLWSSYNGEGLDKLRAALASS